MYLFNVLYFLFPSFEVADCQPYLLVERAYLTNTLTNQPRCLKCAPFHSMGLAITPGALGGELKHYYSVLFSFGFFILLYCVRFVTLARIPIPITYFILPCLLVPWLAQILIKVRHLWEHSNPINVPRSLEKIILEQGNMSTLWLMNDRAVVPPLPMCHICKGNCFKLMFEWARIFHFHPHFLDSFIPVSFNFLLSLPSPMGGARNEERTLLSISSKVLKQLVADWPVQTSSQLNMV